jgi:osmotically-inducible protein OsmY
MAEWDPDRESFERERDFRRDYVDAGVGYRGPDRRSMTRRGVLTLGGSPREPRAETGMAQVPFEAPARGSVGRGPYVGRGPRNWRRTDTQIRDEVCSALERDGDVDASGMDVEVANGEVTLLGSVPDRRMRRLAEDVAAACAGVHDVHNRLRVADDEG